jgi:NDP-sugar pyrophosphorylase family protein
MVPVLGRPILEYQIDRLKNGGVTDVVFLAGYHWQAIREHFGDGSQFGLRAHYSVEDSPLGRGGAVKKGFSSVTESENPVVVLNRDTITMEPLESLLGQHEERVNSNPSHLATMMVVPFVSPYSVIELGAGDVILGINKNPQLSHWINAGVYIFEKDIVKELPDIGDHETTTFTRLVQTGQLLGVKSTEFWIGIDSFVELREVENYLCSISK